MLGGLWVHGDAAVIGIGRGGDIPFLRVALGLVTSKRYREATFRTANRGIGLHALVRG